LSPPQPTCSSRPATGESCSRTLLGSTAAGTQGALCIPPGICSCDAHPSVLVVVLLMRSLYFLPMPMPLTQLVLLAPRAMQ
jgi:hypothetical protein